MIVALAYGRTGLDVEVPDSADIVVPQYTPGFRDEERALLESFRHPIQSPPLAELVTPGDSAVVVHTDITRATPNALILPVLLAELESAGVRREDITLLNGLGTHRKQTEGELRSMLGDSVVDRYRCHQHDCYDDANLVPLDRTSLGHPVRINKQYLDADLRILTGFIEPHFFAGYSGGPKAVLPSLAGTESVFTNHGLAMIADPRATWDVTDGNPIWEEMRDVALKTNPTFLLNVTLNTERQITGVFAGDMLAAHAQGCAFVKKTAMVGVGAPYDIVLTTNSGYPLDQNLYQSVKGISAASKIVKDSGAIIMAAACEDGLPDHGQYADLLSKAGSPAGVMEMISEPGFSVQDQWQVQIQAQIQQKAEVFVYSDNLSDEQIRQALFKPCRDIGETIGRLIERFGIDSRICVLPEGPQTIPYVMD
ncbi:MAG: nickel-dependent lactate racemase [Candidatus Promineifilaceae bacterium]